MASYLVVKRNSTANTSYNITDVEPSKPYIRVKGQGYIPLTTNTTGSGPKVKAGLSTFKFQETYTTTTQVTSAEVSNVSVYDTYYTTTSSILKNTDDYKSAFSPLNNYVSIAQNNRKSVTFANISASVSINSIDVRTEYISTSLRVRATYSVHGSNSYREYAHSRYVSLSLDNKLSSQGNFSVKFRENFDEVFEWAVGKTATRSPYYKSYTALYTHDTSPFTLTNGSFSTLLVDAENYTTTYTYAKSIFEKSRSLAIGYGILLTCDGTFSFSDDGNIRTYTNNGIIITTGDEINSGTTYGYGTCSLVDADMAITSSFSISSLTGGKASTSATWVSTGYYQEFPNRIASIMLTKPVKATNSFISTSSHMGEVTVSTYETTAETTVYH